MVEKIRQNTTVLLFLTVDNFNFTRKLCKNKLVSKNRQNITVLRSFTVDIINFTRKIVEFFLEKVTDYAEEKEIGSSSAAEDAIAVISKFLARKFKLIFFTHIFD